MVAATGRAKDGRLRATVDCYSPRSTTWERFAYWLTGLEADRTHTIKVVVRNERHPQSSGTAIQHIAFEHGAESYKASAGISSVMGKNHWWYQQRSDSVDSDLRFELREDVLVTHWLGDRLAQIGGSDQIAGGGAAVRKWAAPHGGTVRIEGAPAIDQAGGQGALVGIQHNPVDVWPTQHLRPGQCVTHDFTLSVNQGDAIAFVVSAVADADLRVAPELDRVIWDPVITYTESRAAQQSAERPSERNLALGAYARSKFLFSTYRPFDAVDGEAHTAFSILADDEVCFGDDWLMLDLDTPHTLDRYRLVSTPGDPALIPAEFALQRSDDGLSWVEVDAVDHNHSETVERSVPVLRARYVRLYLPHGKPFQINDFALFYTAGA